MGLPFFVAENNGISLECSLAQSLVWPFLFFLLYIKRIPFWILLAYFGWQIRTIESVWHVF
jgi:hypothetical protein